MIKKSIFTNFIEKGFLAGMVESFVMEVVDKEASIYFVTDEKLVGDIKLNNFDFADAEIGVYNPDVLLKMFSILDEEVELDLKANKSNQIVSIFSQDKKGKKVTYATADVDIIERADKKKSKITDYEVVTELNEEVISDILKSKACLKDESKITFLQEKGKTFIVFGSSKNNTNQIKFELDTQKADEIEALSFNVNTLGTILTVNSKKYETAILEISAKGLLRMVFENKDGKAEYFLPKLRTESEDEE